MLAAHEWLRTQTGPIAAAGIVSMGDIEIAGFLAAAAGNIQQCCENAIALQIRQQAMEGVDADARKLQSEMGQLRADLARARNHVAEFLQDPLDLASRKLLIPMVTSLVTGLVSRKPTAEHTNSKA